MNRMIRILGQGGRGMARNRARTLFMMLATFVGVLALTVILAIGRGTQQLVASRMEKLFRGATVMIRAGGGQVRGAAHGPPTATLKLEDIRAIEEEVDEVLAGDPMFALGNVEVVFENTNRRLGVRGHSAKAELVWNRSVTSGSYFTADQVASTARVALVGETVRRDLFGGRDPIGQQIRVGTVPFEVIGLLETEGIDPHGIDLDNLVIIPITTLMRRVRNVDYVTMARFAISSDADLEAVAGRIGDVLRRRHAIAPGAADDFGVFTPRQAQQRVREVSRIFTVFLPLAAAISIVVGGLVVANLMLMTVQDRRAEIGLRKALGARPGDIRLQFLGEATAVTAVAGGLALAAGIGVLALLPRFRGPAVSMQWQTALLGLGVAVAVGILAGVVPARRAAALDPVRTLR